MSCKELINSLRKASDERMRALWQEAESAVAATKAEAARKLDQLREEAEKTRISAVRERTAEALAEAESRARMIRLDAEKNLAGRLYRTAVLSLPALRKDNYESMFAAMVRELPSIVWETVRENPADQGLALKHFPGSKIVADPAINGGMDVSTADGSIRIINTFEKRLERAWSDMLPGLIKDVYREAWDGTPSAS